MENSSPTLCLCLSFLWPLLLHARSSFVGKKREMYEHPVYCLASQVMDLTIREYLPSSSTRTCLFSCLSSSLSAPHLAFPHFNPLTNNILSLFLLAFKKTNKKNNKKKRCPCVAESSVKYSASQSVSPLSSSSRVCLELPALSRLAFFGSCCWVVHFLSVAIWMHFYFCFCLTSLLCTSAMSQAFRQRSGTVRNLHTGSLRGLN